MSQIDAHFGDIPTNDTPRPWPFDDGVPVEEEISESGSPRTHRDTGVPLDLAGHRPAIAKIGDGRVEASSDGGVVPHTSARAPLHFIEAKLTIPPVSEPLIVRPNAIASCNAALAYPLTTVVAPAGWGKTTVLAQWLRDSSFAWAWLSLDVADNQPKHFATYLFAALENLPTCLLSPPYTVSLDNAARMPDIILSAILVELAAAPDPTVVVIDDFQCIASNNRPIHDAMKFLIGRLPPHVHLILASRAEGTLPTALMRARGRLHEVRLADLRWSRDETAHYLVDQMKLPVSDHQIDALAELTEGWITGVRLAGLALRQTEGDAASVDAITGTHHHIADYFDTEFLQHLQPDVLDVVLSTAVLDRFNASLIDAVCQIDGSQGILDVLERDHSQLVILDELRHWYRYPRLLADLLLQRLHTSRPKSMPTLLGRASAWFEAHGDPSAAIEYALRAQDDARVSSLLGRLPGCAAITTLRIPLGAWLASAAETRLDTYPMLRVVRASLRFCAGDIDGAGRDVTTLTSPTSPPQPDLSLVFTARVSALQGLTALHRGDLPQCYTQTRSALAVPELDEPFRRFASFALGVARLMDGEVRDGIHILRHVRQPTVATESDALSVVSAAYCGLAYLHEGRLDIAMQTCQNARAAMPPGCPAWCVAALDVVVGAILLEHADLERAGKYLARGLAALDIRRQTWLACEGVAALASLRGEHARTEAISTALARIEETTMLDNTWGALAAGSIRAAIALQEGKMEAAYSWACSVEKRYEDLRAHAGNEQRRGDAPVSIDLRERITLARVYLANDRANDAIPLLAETLEITAVVGHRLLALETLVVLASSYAACGSRDCAEVLLEKAETIAKQRGFKYAIDRSHAALPGMRPAMSGSPQFVRGASHRKHAASHERVEQTIAAAPVRRQKTPPPQRQMSTPLNGYAQRTEEIPYVIPQLSDREIEVLELLIEGYSNKELARALDITLGTVKRHVANVFLKLSVRSRTQAIARTRHLRLLQM